MAELQGDDRNLSDTERILRAGVTPGHSGAPANGTNQDQSGGEGLHGVMSALLGGTQPLSTRPGTQPVGCMEPQIYLQGGCNAKQKSLDILDFVNMVPPMVEEQIIGEKMFIRSGSKWPQLDSLSVEEWSLANTRIMHELWCSGVCNSLSLSDYIWRTQ